MPDHDRFFSAVYRFSTEPFLTPAITAAEVRAFVSLAAPPAGARVLDAGCGWGRHLGPLAQAGLRPVGLERSPDYARDAAAAGPVARADLRSMPFVPGRFDAAACFYSSLFFFDEEGNARALAEVARVLRPGAPFVLQAANPIHLRRLGARERTYALPGGIRVTERVRFDAEGSRDLGERDLVLGDGAQLSGGWSVRHYAPGELEVLALRCGLRVEKVLGDLRGDAWRRDSPDVIALLRRR